MFDFMTASILSGIVYDIVKEGVSVKFENLKEKLSDWIVSDERIESIVEQLKTDGVNEDLNQRAIERRVNESQKMLDMIKDIQRSNNTIQITETGNNIINSGSGNVTVGNIEVK
ncbi:hypothetical protein [Devosia sp.]|uniref:GapS6a family protein n=1 Tax=Devosia sp. TaxID=1871048 RepID=UPI003A92B555